MHHPSDGRVAIESLTSLDSEMFDGQVQNQHEPSPFPATASVP